MTQNSKTGAVFIAGGTIAGAGVSATIGGMGLAGGFGAVGIGATPVVAAGAVAGAATYGAILEFQNIGLLIMLLLVENVLLAIRNNRQYQFID